MLSINFDLVQAYKRYAEKNLDIFHKPFINKVGIPGFEFIHPFLQAGVYDILSKAEKFSNEIQSVILFGSCITYGADKDSDIDVYFILNNNCTQLRRTEVITEIWNLISTDFKYDILVSRESEFLDSAKELNTVERQALTRGFEIWRREGAWLS